ncbi:MAG: AsmA-like C-terminal region-containing protein [Bacteroidales bacterium]|jgi:hypothetical protein|nr:AsmA-like C-terminal region-containing protein [Bacteroidales bacterium]
MKKIAVIISAIIIVAFVTLLAVPLLFKQNLVDAVKVTVNKNINADVNFENVKLSLLKRFPKVSFELQNVIITGKGEFEADTLLHIASLQTRMNVKSLVNKAGRSIEEVYLVQPKLKLITGQTGEVNWNIMKETAGVSNSENTSEADNVFDFSLNDVEITGADVKYINRVADMMFGFEDMNIDMNGQMYGQSAQLGVNGRVGSFSTEYKGVTYVSNISLETKTILDINYEAMDIVFNENELLINRLPLEITGSVHAPSDSVHFNMILQTKESGFDNFLALVPPAYENYLENFEINGTATVFGTVTGFYYNDDYPAVELALNINEGNFKYAGMPESINNIEAGVSVVKPQGVLNSTEIKITQAHADIKNNPVNATLLLNNIVSDPYFDGTFTGKIDFNHLKDIVPLENVNITGSADANLLVRGNYSSIENEQYDKIMSDGTILLNNFIYEHANLTQPVAVKSGKLDFSPQNISLSQFYMNVGRSDFNITGKISNYINYVFKEGILEGDFQLNSTYVNLNELLRLHVETPDTASTGAQPENAAENLAFDVPENINFTFRSKISSANFDRVDISDINGLITAKEQQLILNGLNMNMLDGKLKINGSYKNTPQNQPLFDFGFDVERFDIPQAFQAIGGLRNIMPVAGLSNGKVSASVKMNGNMAGNLKLIPTSINGGGLFNTENLRILNSTVFNQLNGILQAEKLSNVSIDDFNTDFTIQNGNLLLKPFITRISGQETRINGSLNTNNLLDMQLSLNIQRNAFGSNIQDILNVIPGNQNITLVPVGVHVIGPVDKPEIKIDLSETQKMLLNATKDELRNSINQIGEGLRKLLN